MQGSDIRSASHAGSWYEGDRDVLAQILDANLEQAARGLKEEHGQIPKARLIIAPYSGPCAGWAFRCLDLTGIKRIFILGPSHTYHLPNCALSTYREWDTPFGALTVDVSGLQGNPLFGVMPRANDEAEHSLEMQVPYVYRLLDELHQGNQQNFPTITPILVGSLSPKREKEVGGVLAPYLSDPTNAFVISTDFCHWGARFSYVRYWPRPDLQNYRETPTRGAQAATDEHSLDESIRFVDREGMNAIESGQHDAFVDYLDATANTICGRHPICVAMAMLEAKHAASTDTQPDTQPSGAKEGKGHFHFVRYERSGEQKKSLSSTTVSYASAYAIV